jgi:chromosome segregation ATPase
MASKKKKMLERNGLPLWGWTVGAVLVAAVIFLGYRTVQTEPHLKAVQSELDSTKEEAVRAKSGAAELEQVAENRRLKLENAERELQRLNEAADRAKAEASERESRSYARHGKRVAGIENGGESLPSALGAIWHHP